MTKPLRLAIVCLVLGVCAPAFAEELVTPKFATAPTVKKPKSAATASAKASASTKERRPGELEGFESGVTAPVTPKARRPADAIGEKAIPDGGLPLPTARGGRDDRAPVGFDEKGNMGGMFRF